MPPIAIPRRPDISITILVMGGMLYTALCMPAIVRRGYPPIDPVWLGVTYLWIAPIWLSALFDSWKFRSRKWHILVFALVTAFVNSGTAHITTPRYVTVSLMLDMTAWWYGPIHLGFAFGSEALLQRLLGRCRLLTEPAEGAYGLGMPRIPLSAWILGNAISCVAIGFPFTYRGVVIFVDERFGIAQANDDWRRGRPVVFAETTAVFLGNTFVRYTIDPDTGLHVRVLSPDHGFRRAYNARIRKLIDEEGLPEWAEKRRDQLLTPEEIVELFHANAFSMVESFPYQATPNVVLQHAPNGSLSIRTPGGHFGIGFGNLPVYIGYDGQNGEMTIIRSGSTWLGVYDAEGWPIAEASRR